jgi:serpin B
MDFLLPLQGPLSALESILTPALLSSTLPRPGGGSQTPFSLPKFSFGQRLRLDPVLASMGMPDLFDPEKADLSGVDGASDLYLGAVVQEALVVVDEQGTVAAASTAATGLSSYYAPTPIALSRPFLFLIRDTKNGSILFLGRVEDPRQGS